MKFFIQKNKTAFNSVFNVYDEFGKEIFFTEIESNTKARILFIKNISGKIVAKIKRLEFGSIVFFKISTEKKTIRLIVGQNRGNVVCLCYGISWELVGNLTEKTFSILDVDNSMIANHKKIFSNREKYELNVFKQNTELLCIAISICINSFNTLDNTVTLAV